MRIFMPRLLVPYEYHLQKGPEQCNSGVIYLKTQLITVNHGSRCRFSVRPWDCARLSQQSSGNQSDKLPRFGQLFSPIVHLYGAENEVMLGNLLQGGA